MRKFLIAIIAAGAVAFSGQAMAFHCAKKNYRTTHKKKCAHWGKHQQHGIYLEGAR